METKFPKLGIVSIVGLPGLSKIKQTDVSSFEISVTT